MATIKDWVEAARLRTLPLALSSIGMGSFLAAHHAVFKWDVFLLCISTTIFLQILSNLANDYGDTLNGADSSDREGPSRLVQMGKISLSSMKNAIILFGILAFVSGITLIMIALKSWQNVLFFLFLGLLSIAAAITYTVGKRPYGYAGLGDISVFIFFGIIAVLGTYYLHASDLPSLIWMPATSCGLLAVGVLNVNNIRDIESDKKAGKKSIPVRLGREKAVVYHYFLIGGSFLFALGYVVFDYHSPLQFIFLIIAPLLWKNIQAVTYKTKASELDPYLKQLALSTLLFVITFGVGNYF